MTKHLTATPDDLQALTIVALRRENARLRSEALQREIGDIDAQTYVILERYGVTSLRVQVVSTPGGPYPIGTFLDGLTGQPLPDPADVVAKPVLVAAPTELSAG